MSLVVAAAEAAAEVWLAVVGACVVLAARSWVAWLREVRAARRRVVQVAEDITREAAR